MLTIRPMASARRKAPLPTALNPPCQSPPRAGLHAGSRVELGEVDARGHLVARELSRCGDVFGGLDGAPAGRQVAAAGGGEVEGQLCSAWLGSSRVASRLEEEGNKQQQQQKGVGGRAQLITGSRS